MKSVMLGGFRQAMDGRQEIFCLLEPHKHHRSRMVSDSLRSRRYHSNSTTERRMYSKTNDGDDLPFTSPA